MNQSREYRKEIVAGVSVYCFRHLRTANVRCLSQGNVMPFCSRYGYRRTKDLTAGGLASYVFADDSAGSNF